MAAGKVGKSCLLYCGKFNSTVYIAIDPFQLTLFDDAFVDGACMSLERFVLFLLFTSMTGFEDNIMK